MGIITKTSERSKLYDEMRTTHHGQILMYRPGNVNDSDFATAVNNAVVVNTIALI